MKKQAVKYLFSIALVVSILLPLGIGFAHAFHNHDNIICLASAEQHIHQEQIDCSFFHYFSQTNYDTPNCGFKIITPLFISITNYKLVAQYHPLKVGVLSSRGPPQINAL